MRLSLILMTLIRGGDPLGPPMIVVRTGGAWCVPPHAIGTPDRIASLSQVGPRRYNPPAGTDGAAVKPWAEPALPRETSEHARRKDDLTARTN
jgi:hypothetical protein